MYTATALDKPGLHCLLLSPQELQGYTIGRHKGLFMLLRALGCQRSCHYTGRPAVKLFHDSLIGELPEIRGTVFWGPYDKDPTI